MTCSADQCERPTRARGMCRMHYERVRRTGTLEPRTYVNSGQECSVEGCDREARVGGLCGMHYERVRRDGQPGPADSMRRRYDMPTRERIFQARVDPQRLHKVCSVCETTKPVEDFAFGWSTIDGRAATCRVCAQARARAWYQRAKGSPSDVMIKKLCTGCLTEKPAEDFFKSTADTSGLQQYCKTCHPRLARGETVYDIRRSLGLPTHRIRTCGKRAST